MPRNLECFAPLTGIVVVVLLAMSFIVAGETPQADDSTREVVQFWRDEEGKQIASAVLAALAAVFLVWFGGSVRAALRQAEAERRPAAGAGRLSAIAFGGFLLMAAGVLSFSGFAFAAADTAGDVPPEVTQTLSVLNSDLFFLVAGGTVLTLLGTGIAALRYGGVPRWLAIVAIVIAIAGLTPIGFFAFLASGIWILVLSVVLFMSAPAEAPRAP